jgi:hypothetical protein
MDFINVLPEVYTLAQASTISPMALSEKLLFASIGAVLPPVLKLLAWIRSGPTNRAKVTVDKVDFVWGTLIHVVVALFAVCVLPVHDPLSATALGYAAPELLVKALGTALKQNTAPAKGSANTKEKASPSSTPDELRASSPGSRAPLGRVARVWRFLQM